MAKIDLKFLDSSDDGSYLCIGSEKGNNEDDKIIFINGMDLYGVSVEDELNEIPTRFSIWLDVSTAIKFAKTLRTEINKIKGVEDGNR